MKRYYLWTDIETTGIDFKESHLLEVAVILTDDNLNVLNEGQTIVQPGNGWIETMGEFVTNMHLENGLIADVLQSSHAEGKVVWSPQGSKAMADFDWILRTQQAAESLTDWLNNIWVDGSSDVAPLHLAGNSVDFDRQFLNREAPGFMELVHHRVLDVSSVRMHIQDVDPDGWEAYNSSRSESNHRALDDIRESIKEYKTYKEWFA